MRNPLARFKEAHESNKPMTHKAHFWGKVKDDLPRLPQVAGNSPFAQLDVWGKEGSC